MRRGSGPNGWLHYTSRRERRLANQRSRSIHFSITSRRETLAQLVGPVKDNAQLAAVHTAPNHDEPAVGRDVVVRDAGASAEVVVVREKREKISPSVSGTESPPKRCLPVSIS